MALHGSGFIERSISTTRAENITMCYKWLHQGAMRQLYGLCPKRRPMSLFREGNSAMLYRRLQLKVRRWSYICCLKKGHTDVGKYGPGRTSRYGARTPLVGLSVYRDISEHLFCLSNRHPDVKQTSRRSTSIPPQNISFQHRHPDGRPHRPQ